MYTVTDNDMQSWQDLVSTSAWWHYLDGHSACTQDEPRAPTMFTVTDAEMQGLQEVANQTWWFMEVQPSCIRDNTLNVMGDGLRMMAFLPILGWDGEHRYQYLQDPTDDPCWERTMTALYGKTLLDTRQMKDFLGRFAKVPGDTYFNME